MKFRLDDLLIPFYSNEATVCPFGGLENANEIGNGSADT
jgi:hypothetical protein